MSVPVVSSPSDEKGTENPAHTDSPRQETGHETFHELDETKYDKIAQKKGSPLFVGLVQDSKREQHGRNEREQRRRGLSQV